jgi:hypothetical protein
VVGKDFFNEQYLAVVPEKVAAIVGHAVTRLEWPVEASHRPGGWSPQMQILWPDEKAPHLRERSSDQRPEAKDTHMSSGYAASARRMPSTVWSEMCVMAWRSSFDQ